MGLNHINRILVVGPPGVGKSAFCQKLSAALNKPLYHLDDYYWLKNWQRIGAKQWDVVLEQLCSLPDWIIDGNHESTFRKRVKYADLVIMLDYQPLQCLWRYLLRSIKRYFKITKDLPVNIRKDLTYRPKITIQWHIIKLILFYRLLSKRKLIDISKQENCTLTIVTNTQQETQLLDTIQTHFIQESL